MSLSLLSTPFFFFFFFFFFPATSSECAKRQTKSKASRNLDFPVSQSFIGFILISVVWVNPTKTDHPEAKPNHVRDKQSKTNR
jgi:hypothetical protein